MPQRLNARLCRVSNSYLAGHCGELGGGDVPRYNAFAQTGVVLVLQVDKQRANFGLVSTGVDSELLRHRIFDGDGPLGNQVVGCQVAGG